jgi:hypothetical protein
LRFVRVENNSKGKWAYPAFDWLIFPLRAWLGVERVLCCAVLRAAALSAVLRKSA